MSCHPPKRQKLCSEPNGEEEDSMLDVPSDAMACIKLLLSEFSVKSEQPATPFILKSQLYSVLSKDRTATDRGLEKLRVSNLIRILCLPSGDLAIVLHTDVALALQRAAAASAKDTCDVSIFEAFEKNVMPNCIDVIISHKRLFELLKKSVEDCTVVEKGISTLLRCCFITRYAGSNEDGEGYVFSIPGGGKIFKSINAGRRELLRIFKRQKFQEIAENELMKKKLTQSILGTRWHARDLVGSGELVKMDTTIGPVYRSIR